MSKYVREIDSIEGLRNTPVSDRAAAHVRTPTARGGIFVPFDGDPFGDGDDGGVVVKASGGYWVRRSALNGDTPKASWFGNDEAAIQDAINFVSTNSLNRPGANNKYTTLVIPESMLPYDARRVSFDDDVRMATPESAGKRRYNVLAYGADPNSNDTDKSASQNDAAFSAALSDGTFRTVYVPRGVYFVSSPVVISSNQSLVGERENINFKGSVIKRHTGANINNIVESKNVNNGSGVWSYGEIRDIVVHGNRSSDSVSCNGIRIEDYGQSSSIKNTVAWKIPGVGMKFEGAALFGLLEKCFVRTTEDDGIELNSTGGGKSFGYHLVDCFVDDNGGAGISIEGEMQVLIDQLRCETGSSFLSNPVVAVGDNSDGAVIIRGGYAKDPENSLGSGSSILLLNSIPKTVRIEGMRVRDYDRLITDNVQSNVVPAGGTNTVQEPILYGSPQRISEHQGGKTFRLNQSSSGNGADDPTSTQPKDWIEVQLNGSTQYIPVYD